MLGESIKIRTQLREGVLTVRALIRHPMEVGRRRANGHRVPAHFITRVVCRVNEEVVLDADWGGGIAKDPYLSFVVEAVPPNATLSLRWVDNQDGQDELTVPL